MKKRMTDRPPGAAPSPTGRPPARPRAFTLIELLVVITILGLLVTLMVPVFTAVKNQFYRARCQKRVNELADGCARYAVDNKGLYPGQLNAGNWGGLTGTQVLAQAMFGLQNSDFNSNNLPTDGNNLYASLNLSNDLVIANGVKCSIWDQYMNTTPNSNGPTYMPIGMSICYYPSHLGQTGFGQYVEGDNIAYTNADHIWPSNNFSGANGYTADYRLNPAVNVCNSGTFLIIAPGTDPSTSFVDTCYGAADGPRNFGGN